MKQEGEHTQVLDTKKKLDNWIDHCARMHAWHNTHDTQWISLRK